MIDQLTVLHKKAELFLAENLSLANAFKYCGIDSCLEKDCGSLVVEDPAFAIRKMLRTMSVSASAHRCAFVTDEVNCEDLTNSSEAKAAVKFFQRRHTECGTIIDLTLVGEPGDLLSCLKSIIPHANTLVKEGRIYCAAFLEELIELVDVHNCRLHFFIMLNNKQELEQDRVLDSKSVIEGLSLVNALTLSRDQKSYIFSGLVSNEKLTVVGRQSCLQENGNINLMHLSSSVIYFDEASRSFVIGALNERHAFNRSAIATIQLALRGNSDIDISNLNDAMIKDLPVGSYAEKVSAIQDYNYGIRLKYQNGTLYIDRNCKFRKDGQLQGKLEHIPETATIIQRVRKLLLALGIPLEKQVWSTRSFHD
jgi:hypothetical protein